MIISCREFYNWEERKLMSMFRDFVAARFETIQGPDITLKIWLINSPFSCYTFTCKLLTIAKIWCQIKITTNPNFFRILFSNFFNCILPMRIISSHKFQPKVKKIGYFIWLRLHLIFLRKFSRMNWNWDSSPYVRW